MGIGRPANLVLSGTSHPPLHRGMMLGPEQLSNDYGILAATILAFGGFNNPTAGDVLTLTNGTVTRTYGAESGGDVNYDLEIIPFTGGMPDRYATFTNLANAISNDSSGAWNAVMYYGPLAADYLCVLIYERDNTGNPSKIYANWTDQTSLHLPDVMNKDSYDNHMSVVAMPSSEPSSTNFGFRKGIDDLVPGETYTAFVGDAINSRTNIYMWNNVLWEWQMVVEPAVAAEGGGPAGTVSIDSTSAVQIIDGVLDLKLKSGGYWLRQLQDGAISPLGVEKDFRIDGVATDGNYVTAANLNALTNGSDADANSLHTHNGPEWIKSTTQDLTLYVRSDGSDSNDGLTTGTALATVQEAIDRIPKFIRHNVIIDIGEGTFSAFYLSGFFATESKVLTVKGTLGTPTLTTGTTSGTATGGDTLTLIDSGQSWTADELKGMLLEVDGEKHYIKSNTSTQIDMVGAFGASTSGKSYIIKEHKTTINGSYTAGTLTVVAGIGSSKGDSSSSFLFQDLFLNCSSAKAGFMGAYSSGASVLRVKIDSSNVSYAIAMDKIYTGFNIDDVYLTNITETNYGIIVIDCTQVRRLKNSFIKGFDLYGIYIIRTQDVCLGDNITCDGNKDGMWIHNCLACDCGAGINCINNTNNGLIVCGCTYADLDGGNFKDNTGYGILVGTNETDDSSTFLNAKGTLVCSGNGKSGIIVGDRSRLLLSNCSGTGNSQYGIKATGSSNVVITSQTSVTGGSGDITIDDGDSTLSYSTDFATNGDIVSNLTNGCRVERKD